VGEEKTLKKRLKKIRCYKSAISLKRASTSYYIIVSLSVLGKGRQKARPKEEKGGASEHPLEGTSVEGNWTYEEKRKAKGKTS